MENKDKLKEDLNELKAFTETLKGISNNENESKFIDDYQQNCFEHSLIDFNEPVDEYNSRDILPAFPNRSCYIPFPTDNSSSYTKR